MLCKNCNAELKENAKFCDACGTAVEISFASEPTLVEPTCVEPEKEIAIDQLPEHLRPLSPWTYFGLQILYAVPIVGFIFLIIFSCKKSNINRRNFTRSYWCALIILAAIATLFAIIALVAGIGVFTARSVY